MEDNEALEFDDVDTEPLDFDCMDAGEELEPGDNIELLEMESDLPADIVFDEAQLSDPITSDFDIADDIFALIDNDFKPESSSEADVDPTEREDAISCLESLLLRFLSQLSLALPPPAHDPLMLDDFDHEENVLEVTNRVVIHVADRRKLKKDGTFGIRAVRFPQNRNKGNAKGIATLMRVVDLTHQALMQNTAVTKRDMYYQDVSLFGKQSVVDNLVDDLAATFGLQRSDLNVCAASKGLFCGSGITIVTRSGTVIDGHHDEPVVIPSCEDIRAVHICENIRWVLVIEKDAVFQTLCKAHLTTHPLLTGQGLLITGKGYPDLATRGLLSTLSQTTSIPLFALMDADAHGIDILSVYKFGSRSMRHEAERLQALRLEWIGLWNSEMTRLGVELDQMMPLTHHDHRKALSMLRSNSEAMPKRWRDEITHMLRFRRKAELEVLSGIAADEANSATNMLVQYVISKINLASGDE